MVRVAQLLLITSLMVCRLAQAEPEASGQSTAKSVAVVVALDSAEPVNTAIVEFYRATLDGLGQDHGWTVYSPSEVVQILPRAKAFASLGALPAFDRKLFADLYPELADYTKGAAAEVAAKAKGSEKDKAGPRFIRPVQMTLDTLALPGALIVDCQPAPGNTVHGCGYYYYNRASGKITASATKHFLVPIGDVTRWAPTLLASLQTGLRAAATARDERRVEKFMQNSEAEDEQHLQWVVGAEGGGESLHCSGCAMSQAPFASLYAGGYGDSMGFGIELTYAGSSASSDGNKQTFRDEHAVALLNVDAHALENLLWELEFGLGYYQRTFSLDQDGNVKVHGMLISLRPGMGFQLGQAVSIGFNIHLDRLFVSDRTANTSGENININGDSFGLGLRVRYRF